MGNSVEYISYNCVLFSYSQGQAGALLLLFFQIGRNGAELTFHTSIIGNFMVNKTYLKQIYCSYSRTHKPVVCLRGCERGTCLGPPYHRRVQGGLRGLKPPPTFSQIRFLIHGFRHRNDPWFPTQKRPTVIFLDNL